MIRTPWGLSLWGQKCVRSGMAETVGRAGWVEVVVSEGEEVMPRLLDLSGERFGRLVAVERAENSRSGATRWRCVCSCGVVTTVGASNLRGGQTRSCGCFSRERGKKGMSPAGSYRPYHSTHRWLAAVRGRASGHVCVDCGAAAEQWSFGGCVFGEELRGSGLVWCVHWQCYEARCVRCHVAFDAARRESAPMIEEIVDLLAARGRELW